MPVLEHPVAAEPARTVVLRAPPSITPGPAVNPWIIALTVMLATFMEVLDTSVANVSLPHIAGNLAASLDESTWVC
jgi:MFS transporter, DHA2 family, multidrug resistance protein